VRPWAQGGSSFCNELRNATFAKVAQGAIRGGGSQFSRVPQMAVNGAQICDLE